MNKILKENGLSLAMFSLFFVCLVGHALTGYNVYNEDRSEHGGTRLLFKEYLGNGHFQESVFENWESEFLQMAMYVLLTVSLYQKGSAESKKINKPETVDEDPFLHRNDPDVPWPVRKGGGWLKIYNVSLSAALLGLFLVSFVFHAAGGVKSYNEEYLETDQFWFESFQNWQSEFLSVAMLVVLSVFLRQKGSPESKPVFFAHSRTGKD